MLVAVFFLKISLHCLHQHPTCYFNTCIFALAELEKFWYLLNAVSNLNPKEGWPAIYKIILISGVVLLEFGEYRRLTMVRLLQTACQHSNGVNFVALLLQKHNYDSTALYLAWYFNSYDVATLLILQGAESHANNIQLRLVFYHPKQKTGKLKRTSFQSWTCRSRTTADILTWIFMRSKNLPWHVLSKTNWDYRNWEQEKLYQALVSTNTTDSYRQTLGYSPNYKLINWTSRLRWNLSKT